MKKIDNEARRLSEILGDLRGCSIGIAESDIDGDLLYIYCTNKRVRVEAIKRLAADLAANPGAAWFGMTLIRVTGEIRPAAATTSQVGWASESPVLDGM
jgi:hypothetical protein